MTGFKVLDILNSFYKIIIYAKPNANSDVKKINEKWEGVVKELSANFKAGTGEFQNYEGDNREKMYRQKLESLLGKGYKEFKSMAKKLKL
jgi:hypothetical protein